MKGIRVFVRRSTPDDVPALLAFSATEQRERTRGEPASGLIGFLLGDLVAFVDFELEPEQIAIRDFWVARNLRRKRIARAMLAALDTEARRLGLARLTVRPSIEFADAFRRLGFTDESEGVLTRPVEPTP